MKTNCTLLRLWLIVVIGTGILCSGFRSGPASPAANASPDQTALPERQTPVVLNPDVLAELTEAQRKALETNGFVVVPDRAEQIYTIYKETASRGRPAFVTTDSVLHTFHVLYDYALRQAETQFFIPALTGLMQAMMDASAEQARSTSGPVQAAALDNLAFFAVARQLLDPQATLPAEVRDKAQAELDRIQAHAGVDRSPLFGRNEDYSQYVPRGHYTRSEELGRYFRAMMWLGRMGFLLRPGDSPEAIASGRHQTRQALLMLSALQKASVDGTPASTIWERIYQPTAFFVGRTDDLNIAAYQTVAQRVYGDSLNLADLDDNGRLDRFIDMAVQLRPPRIIASPVTDQVNAGQATQGLRFMGQRFVFDSYVFQQLVYDQVKAYRGSGQPFTLVQSEAGPIRGFPRGLDLASVFGSARAADILKSEGDTDYDRYAEQAGKLQAEVKQLPPEQWTENLYWSWLYSLRPLLDPKGPAYPAFMKNPAWMDKGLNTFLGSWAELRHDTVLYAKQSTTMAATSLGPRRQPAEGYVEPEPEVYGRLANLSDQMLSGLDYSGVLTPVMRDKLGQMSSLLTSLETISKHELRGEPLSKGDYALIQGIGNRLSGIITFPPTGADQTAAEKQESMALVSDVHTDVNSRQVLEEGVGDAFRLVVLVPGTDGATAMTGGVFSYYEFKQPMADRLTDEAWQAMDPKPPLPPWTGSFIVE